MVVVVGSFPSMDHGSGIRHDRSYSHSRDISNRLGDRFVCASAMAIHLKYKGSIDE